MRGPDPARRILASITIVLIAGTLSACGRYGRPIRPTPVHSAPTDEAVDDATPDDAGKVPTGRTGPGGEDREGRPSDTGVPTP